MTMKALGDHPGQRACANRYPSLVCNWLLDPDNPSALCCSCVLTSTIPPLSNTLNLQRWSKAETAKRRLLFTLHRLGLVLRPKSANSVPHGIDFRWLEAQNGLSVSTGHLDGVITLNIQEVDDGARELQREMLNEYMRTVLGHLRHEVGHYLFDRFVATSSSTLAGFRSLFGEETQDYAAALQRHYKTTRVDWPSDYVSAYASSHPLEDWAETVAHYLLVVDGLETAEAWGLGLTAVSLFNGSSPSSDHDSQPLPFTRRVMQQWLPTVRFLNAMSRSLGLRDSYAYLISEPVLKKMEFVDVTLRQHAELDMNFFSATTA